MSTGPQRKLNLAGHNQGNIGDRIVLTFGPTAVAAAQTNIVLGAFVCPVAGRIENVTGYNISAGHADDKVQVLVGTDAAVAAVKLVDATVTAMTVVDASSENSITAGETVKLTATTNAGGAIAGLVVSIVINTNCTEYLTA